MSGYILKSGGMRLGASTHMRFGPVGQAVVIGGIIGLVIVQSGVWRSKQKRRAGLYLRKRPKSKCPRCGGFGIVRCPLCDGEGVVNYEKKLQRTDPCPQCILRRWVMCDMCQGSGLRPDSEANRLWRFPFSLAAIRWNFRRTFW
uniref:CR-type domain-containing protein n=1 Tax=Rhodosorus marinus TaxID=101924 RepID=A0A7S3E9K8_9RHOD